MESNPLYIKAKTQPVTFIKTIIELVCENQNISIELVNTKNRKREIVQARQLAHKFAKIFTRASLRTIGYEIGGKDHTTVLYSIKTINNLNDTDRMFRGNYNTLFVKINNVALSQGDNRMVCNRCGSDQVRSRIWISTNSGAVIEDPVYTNKFANFCSNCNDQTMLITNTEYIKKQSSEIAILKE